MVRARAAPSSHRPSDANGSILHAHPHAVSSRRSGPPRARPLPPPHQACLHHADAPPSVPPSAHESAAERPLPRRTHPTLAKRVHATPLELLSRPAPRPRLASQPAVLPTAPLITSRLDPTLPWSLEDADGQTGRGCVRSRLLPRRAASCSAAGEGETNWQRGKLPHGARLRSEGSVGPI